MRDSTRAARGVLLTLASYVAWLESRIEKLERKVAQAKRRKSSVTMTGMTAALSEPDPSASQVSTRAANKRESEDIEELVSDFGYMWVSLAGRPRLIVLMPKPGPSMPPQEIFTDSHL